MTATALLALFAVIVLILQEAARIPAALAKVLDECQRVVYSVRSLIAAIRAPITPTQTGPDDDNDPPPNPAA